MRRTSLLIPLAFFALAAAGAFLGLLIGRSRTTTAGTNSLSVSYVGHRALVEFLGECGFDVVVNRRKIGQGTESGTRGLAIIEPDPVEYKKNKAIELARRWPGNRLIALPKWHHTEMQDKPSWIESRSLMMLREIEGTSLARMAGGDLRRLEGGTEMHQVAGPDGDIAMVEIESLQYFSGVDPERVLARSGEKCLLVRDRHDPDLLLLSDPDALSTGGLALSENAAFAEDVFSMAFPRGAFLLDETHHGFEWTPSVASSVLGYPGIVATIGVAAFLVLLFWAFSSDWGEGRTLPRTEQSRLEQVRNAGRLMRSHGMHAAGLSLFARNVQEALCERFHLDRSTGVEELAAFLVAGDKALGDDAGMLVAALRAESQTAREGDVMTLAVAVHRLFERGRDGIRQGDTRQGRG